MAIPVLYDWSGFYIGLNGGWGQAHNCWDFLTPAGAVVRDVAPATSRDQP
jgi:outer membrane immunogenic protein